MALSAAFSIIMIMTGVARTGGNIASLKWLARCSGVTSRTNEPAAPTGIVRMRFPLWSLVGINVSVPRSQLITAATGCDGRETRGKHAWSVIVTGAEFIFDDPA